MTHAKGSNIGNPHKYTPEYSSSFVPDLLLNGGLDSSHQYNIRNQVGIFFDWRKHPEINHYRNMIRNYIFVIFISKMHWEQRQSYDIAKILENQLFDDAVSQEEYVNRETLLQRLKTKLHKLCANKCYQVDNSITCTSKILPSARSLHSWSNGSAPGYASQKVVGPHISATDYSAVATDNKYEFPKAALSSIPKCTELDVLSQFPATSVGRSNLVASSKSVEGSYHFLGSNSLGNIRQREYQKQNFEQNNKNFEHGFLLKCFRLKLFNTVPRDKIINFLHSKVCLLRETCTCGWNSGLLFHFESCRNDDCGICERWNEEAGISRSHSEFLNRGEPVKRKNKDILPLAKRRKVESKADCKVEEITDPVFDSESNTQINEDDLMNVTLGQPLENETILKGCRNDDCGIFERWNEEAGISRSHSEFLNRGEPVKRKNDEDILPLAKRRKVESKADCKVEEITDPVFDSESNTQINEDDLMNVTLGQPLENETILKGCTNNMLDSEEPTKNHDVIANGNLEDAVTVSDSDSNMEVMLPLAKRRKVESKADCKVEEITDPVFDSESNTQINEDDLMNVTLGQPLENETILNGCTNNMLDSEEPTKNHVVIANGNLQDAITVSDSDSNMEVVCEEYMASNTEDIQGGSGFNQDEFHAPEKVIEPKAQEKEMESTNSTANTISLTESRSGIKEHIRSLRKQYNKDVMAGESGSHVFKCQLCSMGTLYFAPQPIYCFCCGISVRRNAYYYYRREEDTHNCFCTTCYKNARDGNITFNGITVSKTDLDKKQNNRECEEAWVECSKCKSWQHQICALYNDKRDLDYSAEYICLLCCLNENRNDVHVPFDAKGLPRTMLSDHIEGRLLKSLGKIGLKVKRNENPGEEEVFVADNLFVRVVLSVDKQIEVKKQFLDIFEGENYPAEFSYTSKVILLFQKIDGVDVCLFVMYVQEFGSECGYPNQRSVYISYIDSVKYFTPEIRTAARESLRTFVYHEILVGYLDFCKKRGFTTCYIWSCPPNKGEDYILYCHPETQKTPKKDQLRHWYHSALRKAAEEDIVVGLTNIYDHFFLSTGKCGSKVTAARLPCFDGDFWSSAAMDKARQIEQQTGGDRGKMLKLIPNRSLKSMGYVNLSKRTAKDFLVMQKLGQTISPFKEDFMVVQLQYVCIHCHKVIERGKRWFCTECKIFQECERCHTADSHTSVKGEKHRLCQVLMEHILCDTTKEKDIIFDNGLFNTRYNFLSFCQRNMFQFDSLRRAKYSSMMILYFLSNPTHMTFRTTCRVCCKRIVSQSYWKCENCPEFTVCSACHITRGAKCHAHALTETCSAAQSPLGSLELQQNTAMLQELLDVIKHASQCYSTQTQPCTYPYCLKIRKLFAHASRCTVRVSGGCQYCKKVWQSLTLHSRNCTDSACRVPRCMDMKKQAEWLASKAESRRRAAILEDYKELAAD